MAVFVFDFDETITNAPEVLGHIAGALRANGDKVVVLTGNKSTQEELEGFLAGFNFPYDELVQYKDESSDDNNPDAQPGLARSMILADLEPMAAFDDRVSRAVRYTTICPHLFLVSQPRPCDPAEEAEAEDDAQEALGNATGRQFPLYKL